MALLTKAVDFMVGGSYSPALAIAIITVLIMIIMYFAGTDDTAVSIVKWVGGLSLVGYLGLGTLHSTKSLSTPANAFSQLVM